MKTLLSILILFAASTVHADIVTFELSRPRIDLGTFLQIELDATIVVDTAANTAMMTRFDTPARPRPEAPVTIGMTPIAGNLETVWDVPDDPEAILAAIDAGGFAIVADDDNSLIRYEQPGSGNSGFGSSGKVGWGAHVTTSGLTFAQGTGAIQGVYDADDFTHLWGFLNVSYSVNVVPEPAAACGIMFAALAIATKRRRLSA